MPSPLLLISPHLPFILDPSSHGEVVQTTRNRPPTNLPRLSLYPWKKKSPSIYITPNGTYASTVTSQLVTSVHSSLLHSTRRTSRLPSCPVHSVEALRPTLSKITFRPFEDGPGTKTVSPTSIHLRETQEGATREDETKKYHRTTHRSRHCSDLRQVVRFWRGEILSQFVPWWHH